MEREELITNTVSSNFHLTHEYFLNVISCIRIATEHSDIFKIL
jgi:hypothetical protein